MTKKRECIGITGRNFEEEVLQSPGPVLVEFIAEWSGACHIIAPVIEQLLDDFNGKIKFCSVNADFHKDITETYGIFNLPTFLFFRDGNLIDHIKGAASKKVLASKLNMLLQ